MKRFYFATFVVLIIACSSCGNKPWKKAAENPDFVHRSIKDVTDVVRHDIYSPPVASRIYAYISVAAYEAARNGDSKYLSLEGQLKGLDSVPKPIAGKQYCYTLAASHAV